MPPGFRYQRDVITAEAERALLSQIERLPFKAFQFHVTEYSAGAGIGWHRDKAMFGDVIGISLLSACTFRLRLRDGDGWRRASVVAEPRSAYLMRGPSRTDWEHSIPPVNQLRYSVTFRNFREDSVSS